MINMHKNMLRYLKILYGFITFRRSYYLALINILTPPLKRLYFCYLQYMNLCGNYLVYKSRLYLNHSTKKDDPRDTYEWFYKERYLVLKKIHQLSLKEWKEYPYSHYLYGFPYQTLGMLNIFGGRCSEERFEEYELIRYLDKNSKILDLGANCGFMAILTSYRLGCNAVAVDLNPYSIEIGTATVDFLRLNNRVKLFACDLKMISSEIKEEFNAVFAFATHWTADGNNRIDLREYLAYLADLITTGGYIFFESHCADINSKCFLDVIELFKSGEEFLTVEKFKTIQNGSRYFLIFKKNDMVSL